MHLLHTKPSLSTMTIRDDLPALYHFLMNQHDLKNHHSRWMMLPPSWGKSRVLIQPISGLWWVVMKRGHSIVVMKAAKKKYIKKAFLKAHIIKHPNDSESRCYTGDCSGAVRYRDKRALTRHIQIYHTFERLFGCEICDRRFRRPDHLKSHREHMHSINSKKITKTT